MEYWRRQEQEKWELERRGKGERREMLLLIIILNRKK
jgi:hypothetical protein